MEFRDIYKELNSTEIYNSIIFQLKIFDFKYNTYFVLHFTIDLNPMFS